jgi:hypothetical protein
VKLDGYRAITVFDDSGKPHLWSRNGLPLEAKFPAIAKAVSKLKLRSRILALRYFVWVVIGASQFCLERGFGKPGYKELLNRRPQRSQRIDSGQQVRRFERELKPRATNNESKLSKIDD